MFAYLETEIGDVSSFQLNGESDSVVCIFPAVFGIDDDILQLSHWLQAQGHSVVALDPFWEIDPGPLPHTVEGVRRALARKREISFEEQLIFSQACSTAVRAIARNHVALGICFGGGMAFHALSLGLCDAASIWHGAGLVRQIDSIPSMDGTLHLHFGEEDPLIPPVDREILRELLKDKRNAHIWEYEHARHGFTHRSGPAFVPHALQDSMDKLMGLLH